MNPGRSDFAPLHTHSRFPDSAFYDGGAPEGMVDRVAYAKGQTAADARWFRRWIYPAMVAVAVLAVALSTMWPAGFQVFVP